MAREELTGLGLESESGSDSSASESATSSISNSTSTSSVSDSKSIYKHKKTKSHLSKQSGISAKASDKVKFPQKRPHSHLQFKHVNKQIRADELAGEFKIISKESLPRSDI